MANRFPLIVDTDDGNKIKELPSGDFLDMTGSGLANLTGITLSGTLATANATVSGTLNVTGTAQFTSLDASTITINGNSISSTQVQSDFNETNDDSAAFILNKPTIPSNVFDLSDNLVVNHSWRELISDAVITEDVREWTLAPYQTLWITNA